ncbi:MAG TPA: hypothetical protein VFN42_02595 [Acetobacteraceae bacterium]|nr:hypothetical protein [Acetobacteraceae bacterium]
MMRGTLLLAAALVAGPAAADQAPGWMKPGPGQEATAITCGICHSPEYIRMNSVFLTQSQWQAEVGKMREVFGAPMDDDTAKQIVEYLGKNYAAPAAR